METILAVAIFAIGVLALGHCVENAMVATRMKDEDARIRRLLQNRMAEIEVGAVPLGDKSVEDLKGIFKGVKLTTTREPLKRKNENDQEIFGIFNVTLRATWLSDRQEQARDLTFYVYPRQR
ncbi:MAG TPA: hypothetical protein VF614_03710 [Chthoniobacteraceae bacterium]|jgi:Tfp pilus assembly protein PilV